jgi:hypothetical protein
MTKYTSFTICAKNYIGLAQVLEKSLKKHNKDLDFYIFVVDEFVESDKSIIGDRLELPKNILFAKEVLNYTLEKWNEMSFKYNLTEFCTSIKAKCFSYLFDEKKYEKAIFLDPDILIYNSLDYVYNKLNNYSILLTPHVLNEKSITTKVKDNDMLNTGVFNLGFIGLKNNEVSLRLLNWWNERLNDYCFIDYNEGYFTDQKWMDLIPGYFNKGELYVCDNLGMNIAIWNFDERELVIDNMVFYIKDRIDGKDMAPLIFVHYSGFDYVKLISGYIHHTTFSNLKLFDDLLPLFNIYEKALNESNFKSYLKMKYSYNQFENSLPILNLHRRLYRRLLNDGKINGNPFSTDDKTFFSMLKENNMILKQFSIIDKSNRFNTTNMEGKIKFVNSLFRLLYKLQRTQDAPRYLGVSRVENS